MVGWMNDGHILFVSVCARLGQVHQALIFPSQLKDHLFPDSSQTPHVFIIYSSLIHSFAPHHPDFPSLNKPFYISIHSHTKTLINTFLYSSNPIPNVINNPEL